MLVLKTAEKRMNVDQAQQCKHDEAKPRKHTVRLHVHGAVLDVSESPVMRETSKCTPVWGPNLIGIEAGFFVFAHLR